jgi:predicted small secreted protein
LKRSIPRYSPAMPVQKDLIMRRSIAATLAGLVLIIGASSFLSACNTVEGAGKDVSKAGHEVSEEANEHK